MNSTKPTPTRRIPKELPNIFCKRLKEARKKLGISQKELGKRIELDEFSASTRINRYELGVHKVDVLTAEKLAQALGVPLSYLYTENESLAQIAKAFEVLTAAQQEALLQHAQDLAQVNANGEEAAPKRRRKAS